MIGILIKQEIYPKTVRYNDDKYGYVITEKLDGSNLGIGRIGDTLYICQRKNIYTIEEATKKVSYSGLIGWLNLHKDELLESIYDGSIVFGEWIGMGKIPYGESLNKKFYIFGKGRITIENEKFVLTRLNWDLENILYVFNDQKLPEFIEIVPIVSQLKNVSLSILDDLYETYCKEVNRKVEGFVIYNTESFTIRKYIRYKDGKATPHTTKGE